MTMTDTCNCGSSTTSVTGVTHAGETCSCGCCGETNTKTREQEVAELLTLRQAVDTRLTELNG